MEKAIKKEMASVNPNSWAFQQLTDINQEKVLIIYMIACLLKDTAATQITADEFDECYDMPIDELRVFYMQCKEKAIRIRVLGDMIEGE